MIKKIMLYFAIAATIGLTGCANFSRPAEQTDIRFADSSKLREGYWFQYNVGRRGAFLLDKSKVSSSGIIMCAEPNPDAAVNGAASVSAKGGSVSSTDKDKELGGRTQSVLVLREAMYRLCELSANHNDFTGDQLKEMFKIILNQVTNVAAIEKTRANVDQVKAQTALTNAFSADIKKSIEDAKK